MHRVIYIADAGNNVIRKVNTSGIISTIAGNGIAEYSGDGGDADTASLNSPNEVAIDVSGNIYIADYGNNVIRKINTSGVISTFAGNDTAGYSGDGGAAASAELNQPWGIAFDAFGNLYISDTYNSVIRKVNTAGIISTVAGDGTDGYSGDGWAASSAQLSYPAGIAVDTAGNLYVADEGNNVIRKIDPVGIISTFAGDGSYGYYGDGGAADSASLNYPLGIATDISGNVYVADQSNNCIRKINTSGIISTFAGDGSVGYSGDGGEAIAAQLYDPTGVAVDAMGNVYISDEFNNVIRKVSTSGTISTFAGNGSNGYSGDGGAAALAKLYEPIDVAVDFYGNTYISDYKNNVIRKVTIGILPTPDICLVTVDSLSQYNIIVWDKAPYANTGVDSFIIYREIASNNYQPIGIVPFDSLSYFVDTVRIKYFPNTGNPNAGTYRYKLQVKDTLGNYSPLSPYHNTIYCINNNGTFSWPQLYTIENRVNPVINYNLLRDDKSDGKWQIVNSVAGTQKSVSDPAFVSFSSTASWRVETQWGISCTPSFKTPQPMKSNLNSSRSNVYRVEENNASVINLDAAMRASVYPNPSNGFFTIDMKNNITSLSGIRIFNMIGKEVIYINCADCSNKITMDMSKQAQGVYCLKISTLEQTITKKIVIE